MQFKDYYKILGVARTATQDEIKSAFRKLARQYHPDVAKDKKGAEAKFKEINEANEVLSDPEKRRRYDELGEDWNGAAAGPGAAAGGGPFRGFRAQNFRRGAGAESFEFGGTGFSDFFEQFFGGGFDGMRRGRRGAADSEAEKGADVEADLLVTLEEALRGSTRQITLRRGGDEEEQGRTDTYQVRIPKGIREGQRIRLAGQGRASPSGGRAGDVYLRIKYAQHPDYAVDGADLSYDLEIEPWQAVLGDKVSVPTLDGSVALTIPPRTAAGSRLRLKGLGLPREGGDRGDLYATIRLQVPAQPTARELELWRKLADERKTHV